MTTPGLMSEYIVRAVQADIVARLPAALTAVEALWAAEGFPMALPVPVTITKGFTESLVMLKKESFPRVAIIGAPLAPTPNSDQSRTADAVHTLLIEWNTLGVTSEEAVIRMWRYGQALNDVIATGGVYRGFHVQGIIPSTSEAQAIPHVGPAGSIPTNQWLCGGIATWTLKGRYTR